MTQIEQYANLRRFTDENDLAGFPLISCPHAFQDVASPSTEAYVGGDRVAPLAQSDSLFLSVDRRLLMM
jgi:hypothetical protein